MNVFRFDLGQWLDAIEYGGRPIKEASETFSLDVPSALDSARKGRSDLVGPIETALTIASTTAEKDAHEWRDDRYIGASVSVGRFAMGLPGCMRRREQLPRDYRHVSVYACVAYSGGCEAHQIAARGAAILGLLSRLQSEGVSVDLYLYSETGQCRRSSANADGTGDMCTITRVPTCPLDLSLAAALFCDEKVTRYLPLVWERAAYGMPVNGPWSSISNDHEAMRAAMGLASYDVLVPRMHLSDLYLDDPKSWIETMVSQAVK